MSKEGNSRAAYLRIAARFVEAAPGGDYSLAYRDALVEFAADVAGASAGTVGYKCETQAAVLGILAGLVANSQEGR